MAEGQGLTQNELGVLDSNLRRLKGTSFGDIAAPLDGSTAPGVLDKSSPENSNKPSDLR
jgi:hypothetical protein